MVTRTTALKLGALGLVAVALVGLLVAYLFSSKYTVTLIAESADQLDPGVPVRIHGFDSGVVEKVEPRDGKAAITISVDKKYAPLHAGTTARIEWQSVLGERRLEVHSGPDQNPVIPSGSIVATDVVQAEVGEVLNALDAPTRTELQGMIAQLKDTASGKEPDIQATLQSAGPTIEALGGIMQAVGRDGPAIRDLVVQMRQMVSAAATQQRQLQGSIDNLTRFSDTVSVRQRQLSEMLPELPPTLRTAKDTLDRVPRASDAATVLLHDIRPATAQLPETASRLTPVMHDLRPALHDLRPTLDAARELLHRTPDLMDTVHPVLPEISKFFDIYQPALSFIRPYTPETIGWIHNWGQGFGIYDSQGHTWGAILGNFGPTAFGESLRTPPGTQTPTEPAPGAIVGQPWHDKDASGSPVQ